MPCWLPCPIPTPSDIQEVSDVVFAAICKHWFDIPDGEFVQAGGFRLSNLLPPGRCPGDYTPPSGYIVHPDPDFLLTHIGQRTGQILREAVGKFVASRRGPKNPPVGALTKAFFDMYPNSEDNDLLARTIVGVMMGALPTINGNLVTIMKTWMKTSTLMVLQAKLNSSLEKDEFVRAHEVIEQPMQETMQMTPTPDALWRLAVKEHTIGTTHPVQVHPGDKIYLSIVKATREDLQAGITDVRPLFGGNRSLSPHPTHACPGFEMDLVFCSAWSTGSSTGSPNRAVEDQRWMGTGRPVPCVSPEDALSSASQGKLPGDAVTVGKSIGVNDQIFFGEKLKRAVPFGIDGIAKMTVRGREHGNDRAALMFVGCFIDPVANCKLRHRKLLLESSTRLSSQKD